METFVILILFGLGCQQYEGNCQTDQRNRPCAWIHTSLCRQNLVNMYAQIGKFLFCCIFTSLDDPFNQDRLPGALERSPRTWNGRHLRTGSGGHSVSGGSFEACPNQRYHLPKKVKITQMLLFFFGYFFSLICDVFFHRRITLIKVYYPVPKPWSINVPRASNWF